MTPAALLDRVRAHKAELFPRVPDYYEAVYQAAIERLDIPTCAAAISWFAALNGDGIIDEIAVLEKRCADLASASAPAETYRSSVEALVRHLGEIEELYRDAQDAAAAVLSTRPLRGVVEIVGIADDPCLLCGGTEYRLPATAKGFVHCVRCTEPPPPRRRS
jgi:hypothetical protein